MIRPIIVFLTGALALAGCAGQGLPKPQGSPFAFNPGQWQPTAADLSVTATAGRP
jgi:hypothetical protein